MNLPLRQRHRVIFTVLACFVPLIFAAGIVSRQSLPAANPSETRFLVEPQYSTLVWERAELWEKHRILTRLKSNGAGLFAIDFSTTEELLRPDLLLYWSAANSNALDSLPEDAVLLGSVLPGHPTALDLPTDIRGRDGRLILYSLASQELVAISRKISPLGGR